jgi:hypothetical protein
MACGFVGSLLRDDERSGVLGVPFPITVFGPRDKSSVFVRDDLLLGSSTTQSGNSEVGSRLDDWTRLAVSEFEDVILGPSGSLER